MSDVEQVQYFNPLIVLIWILQIMIVATDYGQGDGISWSIPVVGSFLIIQIFMIWKTNYDEMLAEENERIAQANPLVSSTPLIRPGQDNLADANRKQSTLVDLTLSPSMIDDENE